MLYPITVSMECPSCSEIVSRNLHMSQQLGNAVIAVTILKIGACEGCRSKEERPEWGLQPNLCDRPVFNVLSQLDILISIIISIDTWSRKPIPTRMANCLL